jgi:DNA polymerase I-like protein with 3'-5' exonuclease and polymerase domains
LRLGTSCVGVARRYKRPRWRSSLTPIGLPPQVHDEVILEGPKESADLAQAIVVNCMMHPFDGVNPLDVELVVDAKHADTWFAAK